MTPAKIYISEEFGRKHVRLQKAFRDAIAKSGSQWKAASVEERGCTKVSGLQECQAFLQKIRRLPQVAGVHATYLDKTAVLQGDLSRYGNPATQKKRGGRGEIEQQRGAGQFEGRLGIEGHPTSRSGALTYHVVAIPLAHRRGRM
jgi:hypothetical protein